MEGILRNLKGIRKLMVAPLTTDTEETLAYDTPVRFAGVKEVGGETEESTGTEYYDNQPAISTTAEGVDNYSVITSVLEDVVRAKIEGRKADITYTAEGEPISPSTWGVLFWEFPDIKQYQIIQESRTEYVIRMNVEKDRYDEAKLYTLVKNVVGDVKIQFEYVDEIPVLSSGKFKRSICKIQQ